jgi:hypothetical protein
MVAGVAKGINNNKCRNDARHKHNSVVDALWYVDLFHIPHSNSLCIKDVTFTIEVHVASLDGSRSL